MFTLKEAVDSCDNNKIIMCLIKFRKLSNTTKIDRITFDVLVDLIKNTNPKIINYSLSILANACLNGVHRNLFMEVKGIPHLLLIMKTIDNDSIICRACRLVGNLAQSSTVAEELCQNNVISALIEILMKNEHISPDTIKMAFRALRKFWDFVEPNSEIWSDGLLPVFSKYLDSQDTQVLIITLEAFLLYTNHNTTRKQPKLKVNRDFFFKLIEHSKNKELNHIVMSCLSNLLYFQTFHVWSYIEGSSIAEVFIEYFQTVDNINSEIYRAFHKLCTEGAVRSKIRLSGLIPRLIHMINSKNEKKILSILYLFQYDIMSMMNCSKNPKFMNLLIKNILLPEAVQLLSVLSRLDPPVNELVLQENLDVIINTKTCNGVLKNITRNRHFLKSIILSGRVWQIEKAGCSMEDIGSPDLIESLVIQLLTNCEKKQREDVSLAVPFLVKPRNFELLYKLLAHYKVMTIILHLLEVNPVEERVLACIIRIITIFRHNYHEPSNFFQEIIDADFTFMNYDNCSESDTENKADEKVLVGKEPDTPDTSIVSFELDNGSVVDLNKNLICKNSPVLDSMLNGFFMEANQGKVRLRKCTKDCLLLLAKLLNEDVQISNIQTEVYLELLSATDRFLLTKLNTTLTNNLRIDETSCPLIYQWYRKAGSSKNNEIIRRKIYEFLFASSENLLSAMRCDSCKVPLIKEISEYLSTSVRDLL